MTADRPLGSRYVLGALLGRGSTGRVYEGRRLTDDERFAVKVLRDDWSDDDEILQRLFQERRLLEALSHPHVVKVADLVVDDGQAGIVMELVEGGSLRALMRSGPLTTGQAAAVGHQIAAALEAAHDAAIVHGDVKPENVLVAAAEPDLTVKLTDFGVARLVDATASKSVARVGTPSYMAPELITGAPVGRASDLYSLGVLLYEALAGRPPFAADNVQALWHAHTATAPERPDGVSDAWWTLLESMLAKSADDRPDAATVAAALEGRTEPDVAGLSVISPAGEETLLPEDSFTGRDTLLKDRPAPVAAPAVPAPRRRINRLAASGAAAAVLLAAVGSLAWTNGWASAGTTGDDKTAATPGPAPASSATAVGAPSPSPAVSPTPVTSSAAANPPLPAAPGRTTVVVVPGGAPATTRQTTQATSTPKPASTTKKAVAPADTTPQCKAASNSGGLDIGEELNNSGGPNFVPTPCTSIWLTLTEVHYITYAKACLENSSGTDTRCGGWVYLNDNGAWNRLLTGVEPGDRWQLYLKAQGPGYVGFNFSG
jgi:tRNA A-37 threonylcarbamoyl transferase component Bud32